MVSKIISVHARWPFVTDWRVNYIAADSDTGNIERIVTDDLVTPLKIDEFFVKKKSV